MGGVFPMRALLCLVPIVLKVNAGLTSSDPVTLGKPPKAQYPKTVVRGCMYPNGTLECKLHGNVIICSVVNRDGLLWDVKRVTIPETVLDPKTRKYVQTDTLEVN